MAKVALIGGHGGRDPGAVGNGLKEKDLTLQRVLRTAKTLRANYDVEVLLVRAADETISLLERCNIVNKWGADFVVEDHSNAGGGTGFESFVLPGAYSATKTKQSIIHNEVMAYLKKYGKRDRGQKTANFYTLKNTNPSAVLLECLFVDNKNDAALLKQVGFQNELADSIARGIAKALGLKAKPVPKPAPKPTEPTGELPKIQREIAVRVNGEPVNAKAYLIDGTTYLQGLYVAGLFGGSVTGYGNYVNIKTK